MPTRKLKKSVPAPTPGSKVTALDPLTARAIRQQVKRGVQQGVRTTISTLRNNDWLGPQQPVPPQAPPESADIRTWDYPVGYNVDWRPRKYTAYSFAQLQWLADSFDLVRECIERRKDEICTLGWDITSDGDKDVSNDPDVAEIKEAFEYPDRQNPFASWLRMPLEDMFVTDSATIYPRRKVNGKVYSFDSISGATITPLVDESGRLPEPPDPAYSQVIKGMPYRFFNDVQKIEEDDRVELFTKQQLIYFPRNRRPFSPVFGYSQIEQLVQTIAIGIKAEQRQFYFFTEGTIPDSLISVPDSWSNKQIAQYQAYFDTYFRGNLRKRSGSAFFVPGGTREIAMKDYQFSQEMWEWLARMCCAALHVSPQPYVREVNRATAQTAQVMAQTEGLEPDKEWVKALMDLLIRVGWNRTDLRFTWNEDETEIDIADQAKADDEAIRNGSQTIDEIRISRGQDPYPGGIGAKPIFQTPNGPVLLEDIDTQSKAATDSAQAGAKGAAAAANGDGNGAGANGNGKPAAESGNGKGKTQDDATDKARKVLAAGGAHRIVKMDGKRYIEAGEWLVPMGVL